MHASSSPQPAAATTRRGRARRLIGGLLAGAALTLAAAGCGSEEQAPEAAESAKSTVVTPPTDRSVPTVAGPSREQPTTAETTETAEDGKQCGTARGPEGALRVLIVAGDPDCDEVQKVADAYGPQMYKGGTQSIEGWECSPSQTLGELSRCSKGDDAFALAV